MQSMTPDPSEHTQPSDYLKRPDVQGHLKVMEVLREWDPIGVRPNDGGPSDEYDSYSAPLVTMLDRDDSVDQIVAWLERISLEHIGMPRFDEEHTRKLMSDLHTWWKEWKRTLPQK